MIRRLWRWRPRCAAKSTHGSSRAALEKFVDETIQLKNFSQAFATAAEVCRSLEGDCTEHAVLMALCRARKLPPAWRLASCTIHLKKVSPFTCGTRSGSPTAGCRWIRRSGSAASAPDHVKLGDSSLAGGSPLTDLVAVIQVFGRLELEVVEAE
jgi:hypothetical protein